MKLILILLWAAVLGSLSYAVQAEPMARAKADNATVYLHSDKCGLAEVSNLPGRATWVEGQKTFEGCFAIRPDTGVVLVYFVADKTVVAIPIELFARVTSA